MGRPPTCDCGTCPKCKHRVVARAFYQRPENTERYRQKARESRERRIEAVRAYDRERGFREPDKQKTAARNAVNHAIERGELERQPCEVCGEVAEAHHDDYSKPLDVRWLCRRHHAEFHHRINPAPCNRLIVRDYGLKIPCAHTKPCPLHDRKPAPVPPCPGAGESPATPTPKVTQPSEPGVYLTVAPGSPLHRLFDNEEIA